MNMMKTNKKIYIIAMAVLFVFVSLSETTYSLFLHTDETDKFTYNTGILDLEFTEDEQLILEDALPMIDSEALKKSPYVLKIKNTGTIAYQFGLKMLDESTSNQLNQKYLKVKVNDMVIHNLAYTDGLIANNIVIYPGEELTFDINIWLDIDTPNEELGKHFSAKIVATGNNIYKTQDTSGANHPELKDNMLPVYYDETNDVWKLADKTNLNSSYTWYNYDKQMWANSVILKNDNTKKIYDITRNNDILIDNVDYNNGNIILENNYLDTGLKLSNIDEVSNFIRIKFNDLLGEKIYLTSNNQISYYYNIKQNKFFFNMAGNEVSSANIKLEKDVWYILGFTYNSKQVKFYLNGENISTSNINANISIGNTIKIGDTKNSKITIGNYLIYDRVLNQTEITNNLKNSIQILTEGLVVGYSDFTPKTIYEYYNSMSNGNIVNDKDITSIFVWIPRFKYKVWNVTGTNIANTTDITSSGIDVMFENDNSTSGTIFCEKTSCYSDNSKLTSTTSEDNNKYYTHPAFTTSSEELTGIWVGKYEVSKNDKDEIEIKKAKEVLTNYRLSAFYQIINGNSSNDFKIIKNTDWGAISYLTYSKYGICINAKCNIPSSNNTKISGNNKLDTSTGNNYGVFDIFGGANEFSMSNISTNEKINLEDSMFENNPIGTDDYELYNENTFILGDATKEITSEKINTTKNWFKRTGIFSYETTADTLDDNTSTRVIIK